MSDSAKELGVSTFDYVDPEKLLGQIVVHFYPDHEGEETIGRLVGILTTCKDDGTGYMKRYELYDSNGKRVTCLFGCLAKWTEPSV